MTWNNVIRTSTVLTMIGVMLVCSVTAGLVVGAPQTTKNAEGASVPVALNQDNGTANETTTETQATTTETGADLTESETESNLTGNVTFDDQTTDGETVVVQMVNLSRGGFVAVHQLGNVTGVAAENKTNVSAAQDEAQEVTSPAQPVPGDIIGVSEYLPPGNHENVTVRLFTDIPGKNFTQEALQDDQVLISMLYRDFNGNETFDVITSNGTEDGPFLVNGTGVLDTATVRVTDNATADEATTVNDEITEMETTTESEEIAETETTTGSVAGNTSTPQNRV